MPRRPPVRISQGHAQDYIQLVQDERKTITEACRIVAERWDLPQPHTREAVRLALKKQGVHSPRARRRGPLALRPGETGVTADMAARAIIAKALDQISTTLAEASKELRRLPRRD